MITVKKYRDFKEKILKIWFEKIWLKNEPKKSET